MPPEKDLGRSADLPWVEVAALSGPHLRTVSAHSNQEEVHSREENNQRNNPDLREAKKCGIRAIVLVIVHCGMTAGRLDTHVVVLLVLKGLVLARFW
jgi:hypothetical protein